MDVLELPANEDLGRIRTILNSANVPVEGECRMGQRSYQILVPEADRAARTLIDSGISASPIQPPVPLSDSAVLWWKQWREALDPKSYEKLRMKHHDAVDSTGSLIRVPRSDFPVVDGKKLQPWEVLGENGVDIRCEFLCHLPTGVEFHLLVPDAALATKILRDKGFTVSDVDYEGPVIQRGITWWGEWNSALAYARKCQRPILMSFASPRVEQVPGVW